MNYCHSPTHTHTYIYARVCVCVCILYVHIMQIRKSQLPQQFCIKTRFVYRRASPVDTRRIYYILIGKLRYENNVQARYIVIIRKEPFAFYNTYCYIRVCILRYCCNTRVMFGNKKIYNQVSAYVYIYYIQKKIQSLPVLCVQNVSFSSLQFMVFFIVSHHRFRTTLKNNRKLYTIVWKIHISDHRYFR